MKPTFQFLPSQDPFTLAQRVFKESVDTVECIPDLWVISQIEIVDGFITIKRGCKTVTLHSGLYMSILPPYSTITYEGTFKEIEMITLSTKTPLQYSPSTPILFSSSKKIQKKQAECFFEILNELHSPISIGNEKEPTGFASLLKRELDLCYSNPTKLIDLARNFKITPQLFSIHFKKNFLITPVRYRTTLRLLQSLNLLIRSKASGKRIIDIALEVGFNDITQFNRQFKTYFGVPPSFYVTSF